MYSSSLMAFAHHLAAFALVAAVAVQVALFKPPLTLAHARRIQKTDAIYGLSAMLIIVIGLLRVFFFEKGSGYYFWNGFFLAKFALFLLVGVISIYPTVTFISWNKVLRQNQLPDLPEAKIRRLRQCLMLELTGIVGILLCAAFMADGWGYLGASVPSN